MIIRGSRRHRHDAPYRISQPDPFERTRCRGDDAQANPSIEALVRIDRTFAIGAEYSVLPKLTIAGVDARM